MYTRVFERGSEAEGGYEVVNINEYGFEYYVGRDLEKTGLVENFEETIELLLNDGFVEVV